MGTLLHCLSVTFSLLLFSLSVSPLFLHCWLFSWAFVFPCWSLCLDLSPLLPMAVAALAWAPWLPAAQMVQTAAFFRHTGDPAQGLLTSQTAEPLPEEGRLGV